MNKNMKRVLSLVLAFVMMIGMMVPSFAEEAPTFDNSTFRMTVQDGNNVLGENPNTLDGELVIDVLERTAGSNEAFAASTAEARQDATGLITVSNLMANKEYQVTVNVNDITADNTAYKFAEASDAVVTFVTETEMPKVKSVNNGAYTSEFVMPVTSYAIQGEDTFLKYYVKVKGADNVPFEGVNVNVYKAKWENDAYVKDGAAIIADEQTNKDGNIVLKVTKNDITSEVSVAGTVLDPGTLLIAEVEGQNGKDEVLAGMSTPSMALIDLWSYNGQDRVFDDTGKLVKVDPTDRPLTLKPEARIFNVVLVQKHLDIVVKVFNNGVTPGVRKPVPDAEIALYNLKNIMPGKVVEDADFNEIAKVKTNAKGIAVFENVDLSESVVKWTTDASLETITLPYAIKQLTAPEGLTPFAGYILADGYYANGGLSNPGDELKITRQLLGNQLIVEIENHADAFGFEGRIAGENRYETAVKIAKQAYPTLPMTNENFNRKTVVLAQGHQFSDALVAGPVAEVSSAPILLTAQNSLPQVTLDYMVANGVEQVIIMGGSNTVSDAVIATLNKAVANGGAGVKHVVRIEGANRYATAVEAGNYLLKAVRDNTTANSRFDFGFTKDAEVGSVVFVANGLNFADALTASVPAAGNGAPILLTDGNKLPMETAKALRDWKVVNAVVVGGEKSVSTNEFAEIAKVATATRVSGADRTATSLEVARKFLSGASHAYFANGMKAADALTGVVLGVKDRAPIILVSGDKVSDEVATYIDGSKLTSGTILGGPKSISTQLRDALSQKINLK